MELNPTTQCNETGKDPKNNTDDSGTPNNTNNGDGGDKNHSYAKPLVKANLLAMMVSVVPILFGDNIV